MRTVVRDRPPAGQAAMPEAIAESEPLGRETDLGWHLPNLTLEQVLWFGLIAAAFVLRIWNVGGRAMHHDESMHAFYSWQLMKGDGYQYNPLLHGPFQFHAMALMYLLFGVGETSARLMAVICGTIIVGAVWFLRPFLGRLGALLTGGLLALSPSFLYFSRFAREDIYVTAFTLLMVAGLFGWLHSRRPGYIYLLFTATALAFATKESTFITLFIFGTFLLGVLGLEALGLRPKAEASVPGQAGEVGPDGVPARGVVTASVLAIPPNVWTTGIVCFLAVTFALYTTLGTNMHGLVDAFTSSLKYWLTQQGVHRGDQPAYYYALLLPAYEQIPVLFGIIGMGYFVFRRWFVAFLAASLLGAQLLAVTAGTRLTAPLLVLVTLVLGVSAIYFGVTQGRLLGAFLTYWAILAFIIYSWAGEKMPWLDLQIALPLTILAGMFLGKFLSSHPWGGWRWTAAIAAAVLGVYAIHIDWPLNYYRGDVPKDLLIYTQTSPQVKEVVSQINGLSDQLTGGKDLKILVDNSVTWPFAWYLRDYKNLSYTGNLSSPPDQPVVITAVENDAADKPQLTNYVGNRYKLRWWFSEDYRDLTLPKAVQSLTDPAMRKTLWNWLTLRETPSPSGSYDFNLWIRKDLAPGLISNFESLQQAQAAAPAAGPVAQGPDPFAGRTEKIASLRQIGSGGQGDGQLSGSRGVAVAADGSVYVADMDNNRIEKFDANGKFLLKWGSKGKGDGQFDSPSGVALDKNGNVWVSDLWNHRVQEFDGNGKFLLKFGVFAAATGKASPGSFFGPRDVAVGPQGDVYVTDTGNKRVQKYAPNGTLQTMWGQPGSGPGQFEEPIGIAVDRQGNVYVADTWNRRIQKFDANGTFQSQIAVGSWPAAQTNYGEPFLAVEPNGTVLATDPLRARVLAFSPTGSLVQAWGGSGSDPSSLSAPTGIAVEPNGQVLVSDTLNKRLLVFPAPK